MTRFVPDELSLTMWGASVTANGAAAVVADPLPPELIEAWDALSEELGAVEVRTAPSPLPAPLPRRQALGGDAHHADHGGHHAGGHDHGDMMAITGEPSADGLVMEPIRFQHGPLAAGLPGGIVLDVELDGDVVSRCEVQAILRAPGSVPDPLTPVAWRSTVAADRGWLELADIERERALSHAAWLRGLARVLGWARLVDRAEALVRAIGEAGEAALPLVDEVTRDLLGDRRLRARLRGHGRVTVDDTPGLQGPNARAAGEARDARVRDPRYAALGFTPVVEVGGDALARTRVRLRELAAAMRIARAAQARSAPAPPRTPMTAIEGPRGPVMVAADTTVAVGTGAALKAAGTAAVGLEWSAALAVIASFDLSPWRVLG